MVAAVVFSIIGEVERERSSGTGEWEELCKAGEHLGGVTRAHWKAQGGCEGGSSPLFLSKKLGEDSECSFSLGSTGVGPVFGLP